MSVTPEIVAELDPELIVPVSVPPSVPVPVALVRVMVVFCVTFVAVPLPFSDTTVTEKALPAVGLAGLIVVMANCVGAAEFTVCARVPLLAA